MKTDLECIQDVKNGNKQAFEELVRRHSRFLMKTITRMTRDLDTAEDIVQESFIKAYRRLNSFEGRSSFRSWLYQIAVNTARNHFRKVNPTDLGDEAIDIPVRSQSEGNLALKDVRHMLEQAVARLPERQRTALSLRVFEDMSFHEIADAMACPYDTAKANYRHALLKLKTYFQDEAGLKACLDEVDV